MINIAEIEQWRPVKGYEGLYAVSNFGNIVSLIGCLAKRALAHCKKR